MILLFKYVSHMTLYINLFELTIANFREIFVNKQHLPTCHYELTVRPMLNSRGVTIVIFKQTVASFINVGLKAHP